MFSRPKCRHCKRAWTPAHGVIATKTYCPKCSNARQARAARGFGMKPVTPADFDGPYLIPLAGRRPAAT
jgi:hypothetical protein